jgi:hypothetical protein
VSSESSFRLAFAGAYHTDTLYTSSRIEVLAMGKRWHKEQQEKQKDQPTPPPAPPQHIGTAPAVTKLGWRKTTMAPWRYNR